MLTTRPSTHPTTARTSRGPTWTALATILLTATSPAAAQRCWQRSCEATNAVQVRVGTVMRLSLQGAAIVLATANEAAIRSGEVSAIGPTAVVRSNGPWKLQISAAQPVWTPTDATARSDKPATDLTWSTNPTEPFSSVGTAPAHVATGGPTTGTTLPLFYRTRFTPESDTPGTYALTVRLTLVSD